MVVGRRVNPFPRTARVHSKDVRPSFLFYGSRESSSLETQGASTTLGMTRQKAKAAAALRLTRPVSVIESVIEMFLGN